MSESQFVLPGDVIVTGDYRPNHNVILDGNRLMSTAIGFSEIKEDLVTVTSLTGLYTPKTDDLVIGKIVSHNALSWEVNINSYYSGILTASDIFGKDYSPSKDDLSLKLKTGDIILARIANVNSRDPLITINGENLGKIDSGELIKISPAKISRLTGSIIQIIEASTNAIITVGQNGLIILKCNNSTGLKKATASIKTIDMLQHNVNLEEKIQNILDENN
jgi:exosome complex component RRP4|tara:strand:- start:15 stop:674 length:660 start_codon:yes stop_codon:yes gene_type:complete